MLFLEYSTDLAVAEHLEQDQQSQSVSLLLGLSQHCQENRHFYHNIETKTFKTETTSLLSPIDSDYIPLFIIIIWSIIARGINRYFFENISNTEILDVYWAWQTEQQFPVRLSALTSDSQYLCPGLIPLALREEISQTDQEKYHYLTERGICGLVFSGNISPAMALQFAAWEQEYQQIPIDGMETRQPASYRAIQWIMMFYNFSQASVISWENWCCRYD